MEPPRKRSITSFHSSSFFKNPYDSDSDNDTTQHSTRTPSDQQLQPTFYQPTNASLLDNSFKLFRPFSEEIDSAHHTFISPISDSEGFGAGRRDSMISIASSCTSDIGKDDEKSKSGSDDKSNDEDHFGQRRPTKPKKRSRATTEQLAVLEETFIANTSPNSKMREYLAEKVGMSERSIQIWFQNRRAKMKQGAKKAQAVQKEALKKPNFSGMYPFRIPLAPNHNGRLPLPSRQVQPNPNPAAFAAHAHAAAMAHQQRLAQAVPTRIAPGPNVSNCYPSPQPNTNSSSPSSFSVFPIQPPTNNGLRQLTNVKSNAPVAPTQHNPATILTPTVAPEAATNSTLSCDTLSVGSWRRVCLTPGDLQCLYNPIEKVFQWQVADNGVQFMMEFPYSAICGLEYQTLDANSGHLILDLKHAPTFFMMQVYSQPTIDGTESYVQKWVQCRDFTEGQQASRFFRHTLKGPAQALVAQIHVMKDSDEGLNKIWKPETSQGRLGTPLASNNMKFGTPHFGNRRRSAPVPDQGMLSDLTPSSNTLSPLDAAIAELSAGMNAQFFSNPSNSNPSSPFMIGMNQLPSSPANRGSAASENVNYLLQPTEMAAFAQMQQQRAIAQAHSALAKAKIGRSASVPEIQLQCNDLDDDDFLALLGQDMTSGPPPSSAPHDMQTPVYAYSQDDKNNNNTPSNDGFYHPGLQSLSTISERDDYSSVFQQSPTIPDMFESADLDQNAFDFSTSDFSSSNYNDFLSQSNSDNMFLEMSSPNPLVSVNTSNATLDLDRLDPTSVAAAAAFVDADFFAELMGTEGLAGLETGVLDC